MEKISCSLPAWSWDLGDPDVPKWHQVTQPDFGYLNLLFNAWISQFLLPSCTAGRGVNYSPRAARREPAHHEPTSKGSDGVRDIYYPRRVILFIRGSKSGRKKNGML